MKNRPLALAILLATAVILSESGGCSQDRPVDDAATKKSTDKNSVAATRAAAEFLWNQQSDDGAWRSKTYGLLKSGQALTPFVLHTLLQVPEAICKPPDGGVDRALAFLRSSSNARGALGAADADVLEYPNYATALALRCFLLADRDEDRDRIVRMRNLLIDAQFCEPNGFQPSTLAYGGWGFGGEHSPGETGHTDISHVRHVLEALCDTGANSDVFEKAQAYLSVLQKDPHDIRPQPSLFPEDEELPTTNADKYDGGFYISSVILAANKGQPGDNRDPSHWFSYATATSDGVLALLACGVERDDPRLQDAKIWLQNHPRIDYPEGIPEVSDNYPLPWGEAIHFYHYAVRAQAYAALDFAGQWREDMAVLLQQEQRTDGSFVNTASPLMKEDDPLVATTLALQAFVCLADDQHE
ncbi:MAG: terpene cyclase/mutase family protein [Planctomycetales bacterium]|nr:terpene cyclase/mutase family protein [Planctomycetales bacterium]